MILKDVKRKKNFALLLITGPFREKNLVIVVFPNEFFKGYFTNP